MHIGEIITAFCDSKGLSYRQFALKCGLTNGYISMLINGANPKTGKPLRPSFETYTKLANGMNITINGLFEIMDDAPISTAPVIGELDADEVELVNIFRNLSAAGQGILLGTARGLASNDAMKKDGESSASRLA